MKTLRSKLPLPLSPAKPVTTKKYNKYASASKGNVICDVPKTADSMTVQVIDAQIDQVIANNGLQINSPKTRAQQA